MTDDDSTIPVHERAERYKRAAEREKRRGGKKRSEALRHVGDWTSGQLPGKWKRGGV